MKIVKLTLPVQLVIPALIIPSLPKKTRGLTLYPGKMGVALGAVMVFASIAIGDLLLSLAGPPGAVLSFWAFGSIGVAMLVSGLRPTAFVKPICVGCRLLPMIKEHEAIHLSGVSGESGVWRSMKNRHSIESLGLRGDPSICYFCPIPKRLAEP